MIIPIELRFKADKDSKSAFRTDKTIKSHDVNTVEFHITIEGLELTDNHTAKILSIFHSSKSQANVDCEIVEGKIIYQPDVNLITMHEHVTNYVYVYNGNQSLDVREFIYIVDLSKIDETSLEVKEVYDQSYADLLADFEQALSDYKDNLPQADSVRAEIDVVLNQFGVDSQRVIGDLVEVTATAEIAEASRVQAESERVQAETERKEAETLREDNYEQLIDTALIEADVVGKVDNKVTELTPQINDLTAQLAQKVGGGKLATLNDFDEETLNFIHDGTGGPIQIESVPKDWSVTPTKTTFFEQTRINLFDKTTITTPGIVSNETGVVITYGAVAPMYAASDYIPVIENQTYEISFSVQASFAWYSNTSVDGYISGGYVLSHDTKHTAPAGAEYLRVTFKLDFIDDAMVAKDVLPPSYTSFQDTGITLKTEKQKSTFATSLKPYLSIEQPDEEPQSFKFKEWNAIGDSITEVNGTATTKYHDIIKQKTGVTVNNYGYSGTGYLQTYTTFKAIWNRLDELSPTADLITVFAGTNDINQPLGEFGDTGTTTIYGGIDTVLQNLISKFPTKTIAVFTPLPRDNDWGSGSAGTTLEEIADAIIEVAGKYSIPVLDLYRTSNLHPWNETANSQLFSNADGVHPNNQGHEKIADKIYAFLKNL